MQYNGKYLKEYISEEPIIFAPPKHMVCWTNPAEDPMECIVFSYDPRITLCVSARTPWNECRSFRHCAEIPEEYYALVVVEHRAVSGINRYGLGKFVTREDAQFVMDKMIELLGGDPKMGSKDIYIIPFNAVRGFPRVAPDNRMEMDKIPDYLVDAYDKAMKKFLGTEEPVTPRINDLPSNAGEVYALRYETPRELSNEDKVAMITKLRHKTERGMFPCKRALEECGWDYDKAYALIRELPAARASKETVPHVMDIDEMVGKSDRITDLMTRTGCGPYHCKKALEACSWNLDAAECLLNEKFKDFASNK